MKMKKLPKKLFAPAQFKKYNWILRKLFGIIGHTDLMFLHASNGDTVLPVWSNKSAFDKWVQWYGEDVVLMEIQNMNLRLLGRSYGRNFWLALDLEPGDHSLPPEKLIALEND